MKRKMTIGKHLPEKLAAITALTMAASTCHAVELQLFGTNVPSVDVHGFASQGYIKNTGHNDYLGGDSSGGTIDDREYGINASMAYRKLRVGMQFFGQKLGQYGDDKIKLDWADMDYQATQWFGLRAGRVKTPHGLYNETLDLDATRVFAFLPQSVYDARLRDFNSSFDGGMAYGNIELKKAGSLDYRLYGGHIGLSTSSGANDYFNNDAPLPNRSFTMGATFGTSLFWNTPLQGLRAGYSYQGFQNFTADRIGGAGTNALIIPRGTDLYSRHLLSAEYTYDKWVFAAEAGMDLAHYNISLPAGSGIPGGGPNIQDFKSYYAYASITRSITDRLKLGAYYSYSDQKLTGIAAYHFTQGDVAVSARYDFTDYLLTKLELHYMDGSGMLFNTPTHPQPVAGRDNSWAMLVAKVTLSF